MNKLLPITILWRDTPSTSSEHSFRRVVYVFTNIAIFIQETFRLKRKGLVWIYFLIMQDGPFGNLGSISRTLLHWCAAMFTMYFG
jgi:hypothetical protein